VDDELEVIQTQMEETRSSLANKLEALEGQILGTVETASSTVAHTVDSVKETVAETVETVKDTFNVRKHIENHPWLAMGGSIATGYLAGCLISSSSREPEREPAAAFVPRDDRTTRSYSNGAAHHNGHAEEGTEEEEEDSGPLHAGMKMIQGLAVGTVMSVLRDLVTRSAPTSFVQDLSGFVNDITDRLGGKRLWEQEDATGEQARIGGATHAEHQSPEMGRPSGTARW
jgi:ElaB/YqjD/DUF883 family membrane-anchored ribosome-binding protein